MEEVAESLFKVIGRGVMAVIRLIVWLCWEFLFEKLAWYLGWPVARVLTLNQFPQVSIHDEENANVFTQAIVGIIGISYPVALGIYLARYFEA